MSCAALAALALLASTGCGLDMSGGSGWIPIEDVGVPLVAERLAPPPTTTRSRGAISTSPLRVVTYNVQYGPDIPGAAAAIANTPALASAGVILVQEIEAYPAEAGSRAAQLAALLGMGYVYVPARLKGDGTHGLAILSAFPISNVQKMDLPDAKHLTQHRIAVSVTLDLGDRLVDLIDVHLDTTLNTQQRIAQFSPVVMNAPANVVIAGDLNTSWVEWVGGTVPVPSSSGAADQAPVVDDYMRHQGFATPTSNSGPTEHMLGLELRLDSVYTRGLTPMFGGVEHVGPSDHWPMWVDITGGQ